MAPQNGFFNLPDGAYPLSPTGTTDCSYAYITRHGNYNSASIMSLFSGGTDAANSCNGLMLQNTNYYWWRYTDGVSSTASTMVPNNVVSLTYTSTGSTSVGTRTLYINGTSNVSGTISSIQQQNPTKNYIGNSVASSLAAAFQFQMYNLVYFGKNALTTGSDRQLVEATPYTYALPTITLTLGATTANTFVLTTALPGSFTGVVTNYVVYVNGVSTYTAVTAMTNITVTTAATAPWVITVYAYNAANTLIASGFYCPPPSAITSVLAYNAGIGVFDVSWIGGTGSGVTYTYDVSNAGAILATSAYTTTALGSGGVFNPTRITLTDTSAKSYTVLVRATNAGGAVASPTSGSVSTLPGTIQSFTTINSTSAMTTVFSGLSFTTYAGMGSVAVDMMQSRMLFVCNAGLYYSTSSDSGTTWSALTLFKSFASYTGDNNLCVSLCNDGTKGISCGHNKDVYSISWTGSAPIATVIGNLTSIWFSGSTTSHDGLISMLCATTQGTNPGIYYSFWNSTNNQYNAPVIISGLSGTHASITMSQDKLTLISETQWPFSYATLSWNGQTPTVVTNWTSTSVTVANASVCFLGGSTTDSPKYFLTNNGALVGQSTGFTAGIGLNLVTWNQSTKTASNVSTKFAINLNNYSLQPSGVKGNVIYVIENIASSGTYFNISKFTFNVT